MILSWQKEKVSVTHIVAINAIIAWIEKGCKRKGLCGRWYFDQNDLILQLFGTCICLSAGTLMWSSWCHRVKHDSYEYQPVIWVSAQQQEKAIARSEVEIEINEVNEGGLNLIHSVSEFVCITSVKNGSQVCRVVFASWIHTSELLRENWTYLFQTAGKSTCSNLWSHAITSSRILATNGPLSRCPGAAPSEHAGSPVMAGMAGVHY